MAVIPIASLDDPRVAEYHVLTDHERLRSRGLFVAEGRLVVERVLCTNRYAVRSLLLSDSALAALGPVVDRTPHVPTYTCAAAEFKQLAGLNLHRGCLALVERPPERPVADVLRAARRVVALEGVGNPDNMGGIFRNAAAFSVDAIVLSPGCVDPLYRKAIRTSMAAALMVPFAWSRAWPDDLGAMCDEGFSLFALTPRRPSEGIDQLASRQRPDRWALLLGSEGSGLTKETLARAHARVRIPIADVVDSLNAAVACGIALAMLACPPPPSGG
ncbi:MAG: RNA methyltransferase [Acidimicrobiia bacterium]|nr:RNA methyltransferase [Acidimicrobiia bacterium]